MQINLILILEKKSQLTYELALGLSYFSYFKMGGYLRGLIRAGGL